MRRPASNELHETTGQRASDDKIRWAQIVGFSVHTHTRFDVGKMSASHEASQPVGQQCEVDSAMVAVVAAAAATTTTVGRSS